MQSTTVNAKTESNTFCLPDDLLYISQRAWVRWLQGLFSQREVSNRRWDPNPTETEIIISSAHPTETEETNKRPIIVVGRGNAQWSGVGRDQTLTRTLSGDQKRLSDIIHTSAIISCIAREGVEAQELAYIVSRMVPVFKADIQRIGHIHFISNNTMLEPETNHGSVVNGSGVPEWRMVRVVIPYAVQEEIKVDKDFHNILHAVRLQMDLTD